MGRGHSLDGRLWLSYRPRNAFGKADGCVHQRGGPARSKGRRRNRGPPVRSPPLRGATLRRGGERINSTSPLAVRSRLQSVPAESSLGRRAVGGHQRSGPPTGQGWDDPRLGFSRSRRCISRAGRGTSHGQPQWGKKYPRHVAGGGGREKGSLGVLCAEAAFPRGPASATTHRTVVTGVGAGSGQEVIFPVLCTSTIVTPGRVYAPERDC